MITVQNTLSLEAYLIFHVITKAFFNTNSRLSIEACDGKEK